MLIYWLPKRPACCHPHLLGNIRPGDGLLNIESVLQAQAFGRIMTAVVQGLGVGRSPAGMRRDQIMDDASAQRLNERVRVSGT